MSEENASCELPLSDLRILVGAAVNSECLGDEQVECLRRVALILGIDPAEVTPGDFTCKYRGRHAAVACVDPSIFVSFADGLWRNAYVGPDRAPGGHPIGRGLARITGLSLEMFCPDCGGRWQAFEDVSSARAA